MEDQARAAHIAEPVAGSAPPSPDATGNAFPFYRVSLGHWLAWTLGLSALGAAVAVALVFYFGPPPPSMGGTASLRGDGDKGVVAFQIGKQRRNMIVFADVAPAAAGKDYQLWILRPGQKPLSLGIFKTGIREKRPLPPQIGEILSHGAPMNVSLEPAGGTPGDVPSGPILFHGYFTMMKPPLKDVK